MQLSRAEKTKLFHTLFFPTVFLITLWLTKISEVALEIKQLFLFGVYPREISGLKGILLAPFIHGDWNHLMANSIPVYLLLIFLFFFYRPLSYKIFSYIFVLSGLFVWLAGRPAYHIGASGLIYGFAMFLFVSGILRKDLRLMGIAALVVFLYGSLFMGMFPLVHDNVSWEAHLGGALSGLLVAIAYRKEGPQRPLYTWEINPLTDDETDIDYMGLGENATQSENNLNDHSVGTENSDAVDSKGEKSDESIDPMRIVYTYREKKDQ